MNKTITTIAASLVMISGFAAKGANADQIPPDALTDARVERSASDMLVSITIHPDAFSKKSNRETRICPMLVNGQDTLRLKPVVVAGRTRYFQDLRDDGNSADYTLLRAGTETPLQYFASCKYEQWMEKGALIIQSRTLGCCGDDLTGMSSATLETFDYRPKELHPAYIYIKPDHELVKTRMVKGEAYIDFPVNKTNIYPDYRRNPEELAAIRATIDAVRADKDVSIRSLTIKGYASPEGPYALNERLAKGRTEALIRYVDDLYDFPASTLHSEWEAEDWNGLVARLEHSDIPDKEKIIAVASDSSMLPDSREAAIKRDFPQQYAYMLADIYPALRHTDYNVTYVVRDYSDPKEIASIIWTAPQKLSLEELFAYARTLDEDSPEFSDVMEIAVRMFPDDPVANLNAATTALKRGEYQKARTYLGKSGDRPEAVYTSGVLEALEGNYSIAAALLEKASASGIENANHILAEMKEWGWI